MSQFIRARSEEQKQQRMQEIKNAVDELFAEKPYHEITLTTIANKLEWTRVNLYQYISTKEEIFLEICADKLQIYYNALLAAFPADCGYSLDVFAQVWSGILNAHTDHLHYCDILPSIVETNVSVDRLATFKKKYYEKSSEVTNLLASHLGISNDTCYKIFLNIHHHAIGTYCLCKCNPLVEEALAKAGLKAPAIDFKQDMQEFILMNLERYCKK